MVLAHSQLYPLSLHNNGVSQQYLNSSKREEHTPDIIVTVGGSSLFSVVLPRVCNTGCKLNTSKRKIQLYQIPTFILDGYKLVLSNDCPHKVRKRCRRFGIKLKVQGDSVLWSVLEVHRTPTELPNLLDEVVPRKEAEDGVQRSYCTSTGRKVDEVRIAVSM